MSIVDGTNDNPSSARSDICRRDCILETSAPPERIRTAEASIFNLHTCLHAF
jgi:hypothetical protein